MSGTTVLSLGIEGLVFSENITLRAEITEGSNMFADDSVELLTTPLLLNPNTQAPINVFIGEFPPDFKPYTDAIARASIAAGCNAVQKKTSNYFIQDDCEFAFTRRICSNPLYEMTLPVVLVMTDINSDWYRDKLTGNYGIFKSPASDDGGNIECLPRKTDKDYGRVMLSDSAPKELIQFFEKQKVQAPVVILSTTRILLRHTDEVACVVNTNGGPAVIVPDVDLALKTIDKTPNNTTWPYEGFTTYGEVKDYYNADGKAFKVDIDASLKLNNTALAAYKLIHAPAILRWFRPGIRLSAFNNKDSCNSVPLNLNLLMPREKVNEFRASLANDVRFATVTLIDDDAVKRMRGEIHCSTNVERVPLNKHK